MHFLLANEARNILENTFSDEETFKVSELGFSLKEPASFGLLFTTEGSFLRLFSEV